MDKIKQAYDLGFKYEKKYYGCSQCVLLAIQDTFGLENEDVFKSASGLAAGIGLMGSACGALTGGVMALSLKYGRDLQAFKAGDPEGIRFNAYEKAKKLYKRFEDEYGSVICRDIQKKIFGRSFNLRNPQEFKEFEKAGAHVDKCPNVVGRAAQWVAEIMLEDKEK
jgi:C_GCAxxG_C_C family probable redox protein